MEKTKNSIQYVWYFVIACRVEMEMMTVEMVVEERKRKKGKKGKKTKKKVRDEQSTVVEDEEERWNQKIKNRRNNINTEREKKEYTKQMTHQLKDQLPQ